MKESRSVRSINEPSESANSPSGSSNSNLRNFFDKMGAEEKKVLDEKLAKAIFVTGTPMDMVSHIAASINYLVKTVGY